MTTTETVEVDRDRAGRGQLAALVAFTLRRLLAAVVLLFVLSVVVFSLIYWSPGDVARNLLGDRQVTPEALAAVRHQYHLDEPFYVQYGEWLRAALRGDFGHSIRSGDPVGSLIMSRLGITAAICGLAFLLSVVGGVAVGIACAVKRGRWPDRLLVTGSVVGVSAPAFAVGLLLLYVFAVWLGWFPFYGTGSGFLDGLWHLALPSIALALGLGAFVVKLTRAAVVRELESDYVVFARSRGLGRGAVLRIVLRNAAVPVVTSFGLLLAYLFGGTVLIEVTFALPGAGSLMDDSVEFKDFPVVQALTLAVGVIVTVSAVLVDVAYLLIDPRLRGRVSR